MNIEKLIKENERYIWKLIHKYNRCGAPLEDLYQEAVLGFIEGVSKYDANRCPKLMYYCSFHIKDRLFKYFNSIPAFESLEELKDKNSPEIIVEKLQIFDKANLNYNLLKSKEKFILDKIYLEGVMQYQVAKELNISPERVRQIKMKALEKLCCI